LDPGRLGSKVVVMRIDSVTDATFTAEVLESDKPVLVDFTAAWCPPCRAMNPILDEIAASRDDLRIVKLDVDDNQAVAAQYSVLSMPTFMLFENGQPIQTLVGSRPRKRLESELEQALVQEPASR
jgi:thioredoxin 1